MNLRILGTVGAVLLALAGTAAAAAGRDDGPVTVVAVFPDASPLRAGNEVKAYGVRVGLIDGIDLVDGKAHVRAVLDAHLPLRDDARAAIRPVSLLGERYLELDPGTAGPVADGTVVIPPDRTSRAVDVDDLLDTLDDPTSAAAAALITTLGEGAAGRGDDIAAAVSALAPALADTDRLVEVLDAQNALLGRAVDVNAETLAALADDDGRTLDALVATTTRTLDTVAARRAEVDAALVRLPPTLAAVRRTLTGLAETADATTPVLRDLRPTTSQLAGLAGDVREFTDAADPALDALPGVLDRLEAALEEGRPVAAALRPAAEDLRGIGGAARPLADSLLVHERGVPSSLENLLDGIAEWAMATSGRDGVSHYFRGAAVATPETFRDLFAAAAPAGVVPQTPLPPLPPAPGVPQDAPGVAQDAPPAVPPAEPGSVTGLDAGQEERLLDQLLGGG